MNPVILIAVFSCLFVITTCHESEILHDLQNEVDTSNPKEITTGNQAFHALHQFLKHFAVSRNKRSDPISKRPQVETSTRKPAKKKKGKSHHVKIFHDHDLLMTTKGSYGKRNKRDVRKQTKKQYPRGKYFYPHWLYQRSHRNQQPFNTWTTDIGDHETYARRDKRSPGFGPIFKPLGRKSCQKGQC